MYTILDNLQGGGCPVKNRLEHIREQVKNETSIPVFPNFIVFILNFPFRSNNQLTKFYL